jgi:hypothetical protein
MEPMMLSFKEFINEEQLDEFKFISGLISKIKSLFKNLKFGQKASIKLGTYIMNETVDYKSRLGYLSEYSTAAELAKVLHSNNIRVTPRSTVEQTSHIYAQKKQEIIKLLVDLPEEEKKKVHDEIIRQETAGKKMGDQIFKDIIVQSEDLPLLTFDIEMTGDLGKGVTKADVILTVTKDSEKVVVDKIMASLKAYKKSKINLANSTFISLFKTLFYDNPSDLPRSTEEFVVKFIKDYGSEKEIKELHRLQNFISTEVAKGISKEAARKAAKGTHGEVIELISKIFSKHYDKHKHEINERMLKLLGFDGDDDFYAAIGEAGKQKVLSTRSSPELRKMIQTLKSGFTVTIKRNGTTNNAKLMFTSNTGEVITSGEMPLTDTGSASGMQGKTNAFFDFKPFLK